MTKQLWREGDLVYKTDPDKLGPEWRKRFEKILSFRHVDCPFAFHSFIENGYITKFIDGIDLHGNVPFSYAESDSKCALTPVQKLKILPIFTHLKSLGEQLGYTLGDITCSNIMFSNKGVPYLIDYDVIVDYPLPPDHLRIWNRTLRIIFS